MRMKPLGSTDTMVSELCLGTMTFGTQTPEQDAHRQIDMALDHGINIADTAEMYPVNPVSADTVGDSERILGSWVARSGRRDQILLATKATGEGLKIVRDGAPISGKTVREAVEGSLARLQTDYIDLYQLHWPNRGSYMFRQNWTFDPTGQNRSETLDHMANTLDALSELVQQGKIIHFGLSNESAWGPGNGFGQPRRVEDPGLKPSRTNTACSAGCSTPIWPNLPITSRLGCWHIRRWRPGC